MAERMMGSGLGEIEQPYRALFELNPDAVYLLDERGYFLEANAACEGAFGYSPGELLQSAFHRLVLPEDREWVLEHLKKAQDGVSRNDEIAVVHPSGRRLELNLTHCPIRIGQTRRVIYGIARDISDRKQTEEALRRCEERYRTLFEESKDVVFMSGLEGKFLDINPAGIELFGYSSREDFLRVDVTDLYLDPEDRIVIERTLATCGFVKDYELSMKKKDGEKLVVLETATAVHDERGAVVGYRGIMRDVTEQKKLERQLVQAQKMEAVGLLAGGVAHDFNNLLTVILGNAELGLLGVDRTHPLHEILTKIREGSTKASALTQQLLAFSRRQMLRPKIIDVKELVRDFSEMLSRLIGEDIELRIEFGPALGHIYVDPGSLEQVMMNLAVNGRDAMPQGGVLTIQARNVNLDEAFCRCYPYVKPGEYVEISVADTGLGMDESTLQRIFEPFFTTREKGTGLGLAVVYGIVKQQGGYIIVSSSPGQGTRSDVYFSLSREPVLVEGVETVLEALPRGRETILMAEDEKEVGKLLKAFLEGLGYQVFLASDGEETLNVFSHHHKEIDLVILDAVMPKLSGPKVYDRMRSLCPSLPCLFLTGYSEEIVRRYFDQGFDIPVLRKPITFQDLGRKVRELLDQKHSFPTLMA